MNPLIEAESMLDKARDYFVLSGSVVNSTVGAMRLTHLPSRERSALRASDGAHVMSVPTTDCRQLTAQPGALACDRWEHTAFSADVEGILWMVAGIHQSLIP